MKDQIHNDTDHHGRKNPFRVPEDYFDELPGRIQQRISESGMKPRTSRNFVTVPRLVFVTGILLVLLAGIITIRSFIQRDPVQDFPIAGLADFAEFYLGDVDEAMLIDMLEDGTAVEALDDNEAYIIQYLLDENIDIQTIIDEL